ncbi:hypothetical protein Nocox_05490 [Nonomuraea coxensis DSM 45129]|uniref:PPE family domain-containing protein n=1 Tax=Nonomuraea coxensis DSM 45129 TaxID=1122611 RepID=A0ABX8TTD0_9ACTN|nr:WXG100 family type VII secretion target [Nonomuraea coxensis]QYC38725.1 hypothetical protein Nocox_05490 [Nonomuraea coxensis DSM 45129]
MGGEKKKTHLLKPYCGQWTVQTDGRNVAGVVNFFNMFQPERISDAAEAYKNAQKAVSGLQDAVQEHARALTGVWEGKASVEAQKALRLLWTTLANLSARLDEMHQPVADFSTVVRKHKEFIDDTTKGVLQTWANQNDMLGSSDDSIPDIYSTYTGVFDKDNPDQATTDFGSQDELAGLHLRTFANDLAYVHAKIPDTVDKTLMDITPSSGQMPTPPPVTYPGGVDPRLPNNLHPNGPGNLPATPAGYNPSLQDPDNPRLNPTDPNAGNPPGIGDPNGPNGNVPGTGPGTGTMPNIPNTNIPGTNVPGLNSPNGSTPGYDPAANLDPSGTNGNNGTSLQDFNPSNPNGYNPSANPNSTSNPGTYGNPGGSTYPGSTAYGTPAAYRSGTTAGIPGTATGGGNVTANPAATTAATRAGTTGTGMPFLPMGAGAGAGAGGQQSEKRESTTWLHEDDDVWGTNPDGTVNSQIG